MVFYGCLGFLSNSKQRQGLGTYLRNSYLYPGGPSSDSPRPAACTGSSRWQHCCGPGGPAAPHPRALCWSGGHYREPGQQRAARSSCGYRAGWASAGHWFWWSPLGGLWCCGLANGCKDMRVLRPIASVRLCKDPWTSVIMLGISCWHFKEQYQLFPQRNEQTQTLGISH